MKPKSIVSNPETQIVVKALQRVMDELGLSLAQLSKIVGKSDSTLSRLFNQSDLSTLKADSKEYELALLLIRAYRALADILNDDRENCRKWFHSHNAYFGKTPIEEAYTVDGLSKLCAYLDAMRGKV